MRAQVSYQLQRQYVRPLPVFANRARRKTVWKNMSDILRVFSVSATRPCPRHTPPNPAVAHRGAGRPDPHKIANTTGRPDVYKIKNRNRGTDSADTPKRKRRAHVRNLDKRNPANRPNRRKAADRNRGSAPDETSYRKYTPKRNEV